MHNTLVKALRAGYAIFGSPWGRALWVALMASLGLAGQIWLWSTFAVVMILGLNIEWLRAQNDLGAGFGWVAAMAACFVQMFFGFGGMAWIVPAYLVAGYLLLQHKVLRVPPAPDSGVWKWN